MQPKHVALVIADIGGYTNFIRQHKTALLHAEEIISQLLEAIIESRSFHDLAGYSSYRGKEDCEGLGSIGTVVFAPSPPISVKACRQCAAAH